jgi:predicted hotdog family 3-hydroxylacyl-ACP dehydratase
MSLGRADICALLPHTGNMCLLEAVQDWNGDEITCLASSHRDPDNPLRRGDLLPAVCGVEYAAQAMGVHGRLVARNQSKPAAGYLASLRDLSLTIDRLDQIEGALTIWARRLADSGESVMCEFALRAGDRTLVSGRATLLLEVR